MALIGERITVDKTYAQMEALIAAEELNPFLWYKITDRGDRGLVFRAAAANRLESNGTRYMLCPATYAVGVDAYDNDWIGVWNATKQATATTGQLCIWNGLVWVAGETMDGNAPDTETSGWTVIPKASFTNHEYVEMIFGVTYDFANDWINKQWDWNGNQLGIPFQYFIDEWGPIEPYVNPINYCDWNFDTSGFYMRNNRAYLIYNNSNNGDIVENSVELYISHNSNNSTIQNNYCRLIYNNSNNGTISSNRIGGSIESNSSLLNANVNIMNNTNNGSITGVWDADVTDPVVSKIGTA